jgi:hypothetical protein
VFALLLLSSPGRAAELPIRLRAAHAPEVRWLDDATHLTQSAPGSRTLDVAGNAQPLGPGQSAHWSGGTVVVLGETRDGTEALLYDRAGRLLRATRVPGGSRAIAYGSTAVYFDPGLHEPELDYRLEIDSLDGRSRVERRGRTILDLRPLEQHLVVTSIAGGDATTLTADVFDEAGRIVWSFTDAADRPPRIVTTGDRVAAVFPGRQASRLVLGDGPGNSLREVELAGARLTDVAFLNDSRSVLVWGRHEAALVDADRFAIVWRVDLAHLGTAIGNETSSIAVHGKRIVVALREEQATEGSTLSLVQLDLATGRLAAVRPLFTAPTPPRSARRFRHGQGERLVVADRVWEIGAVEGRSP